MGESGTSKHDFGDGNGNVDAHRHSNGGGWIADTATVMDTVYVGRDAQVFGDAEVSDHARIRDGARVSGRAEVYNPLCRIVAPHAGPETGDNQPFLIQSSLLSKVKRPCGQPLSR